MTAGGFDATALTGRRALVTGAGSGIGRATAIVLAEIGARVALLDIDDTGLAETFAIITELGVAADSFVCDLAMTDEVQDVADRILGAVGPITILVNNAGIPGRNLLDTSLEKWHEVLAVNLTAPFLLLQTLGRRMVDEGVGGSIVNVSSSSAFRAVRSGGPYAVSKAGLGALTRAAAFELGPHHINVNTVAPGLTRTRLTLPAYRSDEGFQDAVTQGPLANLLGRPSEAEDIANVIAFLCLPASRQITGQVIHVSGGAVVCAG
jgi:NAD(P)-dependent dehydrogenase (short-subunit alcohol dehydrogenase family)